MTAGHPPARLLIVDDDELLRSMAARTLQHAGFEVQGAADGEAGLAYFEQGSYDLVLLDVMMPRMDGFEVSRRIRALAQGARIPVLMLTGLNDTESIESAYRHGATDFITKPINWTLLSHRVRYALRASLAAEEMRRSRESLARAQRLAGMGNWTLHLDGRMECSAELPRLLDVEADNALCRTEQGFFSLVASVDRARVCRARERLLGEGRPYQLEFMIERPDGQRRTVFEQASRVLDERGQTLCVEGITQDITERAQAQETIRRLACYDATTGLPNGQFFAELAAPALDLARRQGTQCAVLHLDLDRFKGINDAFGRGSGDSVLQTVAERLRAWIRGSDLASANLAPPGALARVGGNAFTVLIAGLVSQQQAAAVAQRLLTAIAQPIEVRSQSLVITASMGIALFPTDAQDLAGLTCAAEQAAYAAKGAGRAQHRFFDERMNMQASSRLLLEVELRRAISEGELRLHFQPKVDARTGALIGAEALVRWQHPERGLVPPGEFIGLAEDTGLILPLTDWVLMSACGSLRSWRDAGLPDLPLAVNLAAPSLKDASLVGKLDALIQRFGLVPSMLTLEVTETILMHDVESSVALLETLRARGYGLSLDDFGTGYSSLSYLKRFPLDELKIDRSFVTDAARGGRDGALAAAIITLGRELGLRVVAEGVETPAQRMFLLRQGCTAQQGYLFSKPVVAGVLESVLRGRCKLPLHASAEMASTSPAASSAGA